jgi:hypothetical protein
MLADWWEAEGQITGIRCPSGSSFAKQLCCILLLSSANCSALLNMPAGRGGPEPLDTGGDGLGCGPVRKAAGGPPPNRPAMVNV